MLSSHRRVLLAWPALLALGAAVPPYYPAELLDEPEQMLPAFFSRHRVREIWVTEQGGRQAAGRVAYVQQLDRQGRLTGLLQADEQGRFTSRVAYTYYPSGRTATYATWRRLTDPADTTRQGQVWLPDVQCQYPAQPTGTATTAQRDPQTGDWHSTPQPRFWVSRDTAYTLTAEQQSPFNTTLERTYTTPDSVLHYAQLRYRQHRLVQVAARTVRQHHGQEVADSYWQFTDALPAYEQPSGPRSNLARPYHAAFAYLTRRATGPPTELTTRTYDAQRRLLVKADPYWRLTPTRNGQGQIVALDWQCVSLSLQPRHVAYTYQPDGLVASESTATGQSLPDKAAYYHYVYY